MRRWTRMSYCICCHIFVLACAYINTPVSSSRDRFHFHRHAISKPISSGHRFQLKTLCHVSRLKYISNIPHTWQKHKQIGWQVWCHYVKRICIFISLFEYGTLLFTRFQASFKPVSTLCSLAITMLQNALHYMY